MLARARLAVFKLKPPRPALAPAGFAKAVKTLPRPKRNAFSTVSDLKTLVDLRNCGLLSKSEFEIMFQAEKRKLLAPSPDDAAAEEQDEEEDDEIDVEDAPEEAKDETGSNIVYKTAKLAWDKHQGIWIAIWHAVNFEHTTRLILYTPEEVIIILHDGTLGVSSNGVRDPLICLYGRTADADPADATKSIDAKLQDGDCKILARIPLDDPRIKDAEAECPVSRTDAAYQGKPLALEGSRGNILASFARAVDEELNETSTFGDAPVGCKRTNGSARGKNQSVYDYMRDGTRVEVKSAQLVWIKDRGSWGFVWRNIKLGTFDELRLVMYTPDGVLIYRHDGETGLASNGKLTATRGHVIKLFDTKKNEDPSKALESILAKLDGDDTYAGCKMLMAKVPLDDKRFDLAKDQHATDVTDAAYDGKPLANLSVSMRRDVLIKLARQIVDGVSTEAESAKADAAAVSQMSDEVTKASAAIKLALIPLARSSGRKIQIPFMGKTLVLGVGKRIQDEKHKIWVASVHDPYSFRGPEDRATGGGQKDNLGLQMNGAPKGWSAPAEGQATVNSDANCVIC